MIPALIGAALLVIGFSTFGLLYGKNPSEPSTAEETTAMTDSREEQTYSLDENILSRLEQMRLGFPSMDENGYWLTDPNGEPIYVNTQTETADQIEGDLLGLVKHFSEKGYSDIAIVQIQRFYFTAYGQLWEREWTEKIEKLARCIPSDGADHEPFKESVEEVFGIFSDDWSSVFEEIAPASAPLAQFAIVKPYYIPELTDVQKKLCICSEWFGSAEEAVFGNEKAWLHLLIAELSERGYGEKEIVVGELFFLGSLLDTEYDADWLEQLCLCIPLGSEATYKSLKANAEEQFGINIDANLALLDYLNGVTAY